MTIPQTESASKPVLPVPDKPADDPQMSEVPINRREVPVVPSDKPPAGPDEGEEAGLGGPGEGIPNEPEPDEGGDSSWLVRDPSESHKRPPLSFG
jgi:hypothetical protein